MSLLTAIPQELLSAAQQLEGIGTSLAAQNAGAAAATTAVSPAASDPVSLLQSAIFSSYGTLYQQLATEAQTIQQQFTSTLGLSSGTYSATEAANASSAAAGPVQDFISLLSTLSGGPSTSFASSAGPFSLSGNSANFLSFETGNWASAMSDVLGVAGGGLLPAAGADAADVGAVDAVDTVTPAGVGGVGGLGAVGMPMGAAGGIGQATMVGKLSVPPSWAGEFASVATPTTAVQTVGWTAAAPQAGTMNVVPGMPGLGAAARNSAGFGAPRYGVKPIVMAKIKAV